MAIDKEKTLQAAQRAVEKKKYDLAIEEYRKLATAEKNDPRWLLKIGDTQQKKGDFAGAIGSYEEVARFYGAQGFHLKAVAVYNTVRELLARQPPQLQAKYEHVPVRLAELYEKLQLTSDALATWDAIADRYQRDGRDKEAVDVYKRIVGLDPSNPLAHLRLAEAFSRQKDIEGAIAEFAATAEQLVAQRRIDDAIKVYERLLHHRQDPKYARPAAELYLQRNGPSDGVAAIAKIQICLKSDPKSVELIALLARGFVAIDQSDKAVTIYKESARIAAEQGKLELRREIVRQLQVLAPNDEQVRNLVGDALRGQPNQQAAQAPAAPPRQEPPAQQPATQARMAVAAPVQPARPQPQPAQAAVTRPQPESLDPYDLEVEEVEEINAEDAESDDDIEFEEREAAEEIADFNQPSVRRDQRVAEVIGNADAFRKVKLFAKALTTLRIALELEPRSIAIRERIRDILIEQGDTDGAILEMVTLAAILLEDNDLQGSYDNLAWILEAEPGHVQATQLMNQLQAAAGNAPAADTSLDEDLLEEAVESHQAIPLEKSRSGRGFDELDEPLPSYAHELDEPLDAVTSVDDRISLPAQSSAELPSYELEDAADHAPMPLAPSTSAIPAGRPGFAGADNTAEVEAALEEADFYAAQGVFETARETLEEAIKASPNNPLLVEKLREITAASRGKSVAPPPPSQVQPPRDRAFDIAASLDALDELDKVEQPKFASGSEQVDVEEVFQKFKAGVAAQVEAGDSQTHYDLGIAYEQMMLYDDAINEFRVASKDPAKEALCHSMIGMVYTKKGALADATEAYKTGLHAEQLTRDEEAALLYQLGAIWETRKNYKEAMYYLKRLHAIDPGYLDVKEKLADLERRLGPQEEQPTKGGSGARAKHGLDELDAVFDDLVSGGKRKAK